jgi:hypothetical protein
MKITLILSFVLCCVIATAQEPVQLEVWTTVKGKLDQFEFPLGISGGLSYVPQFKNGAIPHAFIVNYRPFDATFEQRDGKVLTWGFSTPTDTINRYTWGGKNFIPIFFPDINGDGQRDFMNKNALYFYGTVEDLPDTTKQYQYPSNVQGYAKMNNDNCDDLYYYGTSPAIVNFVFGNSQAGTYQTARVISTYLQKDSQLEEEMKAIYKNKQGQWRLLTQSYGWKSGLYKRIYQSKKSALRLYALEFTVINTDSTIVTATQIDEYKDPKWLEFEEDYDSKDPSIWSPFNSGKLLYQSEHYPKILYYASMNTMPDKDKKYDLYAKAFDLTVDKIRLLDVNIPNKTTDSKKLQYSITGNNYEEIYYVNGDGTIQFMKINEDNIPQRICYIDRNASPLRWGNVTHLQAVKDINNDGINDIACLLSSSADGNTLAIVKGQNITTSLEDKTHISEPYPIPSTTQLAIPLYIASPHHYTLHLYSQTGKEVKVLFDGDLSSGSHTLHCNISDFPSGTYILRLSDGTTLIDRLIIINH